MNYNISRNLPGLAKSLPTYLQYVQLALSYSLPYHCRCCGWGTQLRRSFTSLPHHPLWWDSPSSLRFHLIIHTQIQLVISSEFRALYEKPVHNEQNHYKATTLPFNLHQLHVSCVSQVIPRGSRNLDITKDGFNCLLLALPCHCYDVSTRYGYDTKATKISIAVRNRSVQTAKLLFWPSFLILETKLLNVKVVGYLPVGYILWLSFLSG